MAQREKALAAKPDDLCSVPRTHVVRGDIFYPDLHTCTIECAYMHIKKYMYIRIKSMSTRKNEVSVLRIRGLGSKRFPDFICNGQSRLQWGGDIQQKCTAGTSRGVPREELSWHIQQEEGGGSSWSRGYKESCWHIRQYPASSLQMKK